MLISADLEGVAFNAAGVEFWEDLDDFHVGCGMQYAGYGMRDAGYGMKPREARPFTWRDAGIIALSERGILLF